MKINPKTVSRHANRNITPSQQKLLKPRTGCKSDVLAEAREDYYNSLLRDVSRYSRTHTYKYSSTGLPRCS